MRICFDELSLIYEKDSDEKNLENLRSAYQIIAESKFLVFIGFGFHDENLKRLRLETYYTSYRALKGHRLAGTFYGMWAGEVERAKGGITQYSGIESNAIHSLDADALDFLRNTNYLI